MTAPRRAAAASAVAAALALALSACGASSSDTAGTTPTGTHHGSSSSASDGTGHRTGHPGKHSGGQSAGPGTHASTPPSTGSTSGPSAGATTRPSNPTGPSHGSTGGVEVMPQSPGATSNGLPGLQHGHSHTTTAALISAPLPGPASAAGRLVSGYPARVLPGAPGSRILVSSVAPSGNRLQVSLTARTGMRSLRLQEFYRRHLAGLGLQVGSTPTVGGSTGLVFSRGDNRVTLTVIPGIVTRYSLFATFSVAR